MIIERDVPVPMDDGLVLRADIYRPVSGDNIPIILCYGPYGKGVPYRDLYKISHDWLVAKHPDILPVSSREYLTWETADPETWAAYGYACVRVDSRGAGRSPGVMDCSSPRETKDVYECIEWAGKLHWSNGKVGMSGISYYAINQWQVAALQPPHLAACVIWEGAADHYRDSSRHGGIHSNEFRVSWYEKQISVLRHGNPKGLMDPWLGERCTGPESLSEAELANNVTDFIEQIGQRELFDDYYKERSVVDWSKVVVPFLSCASWAGFGLHPRGNFEGYANAGSKNKWLECHPGRHEEWYYLETPLAMQKKFFDYFLKSEENGWDKEPALTIYERRPFSEDFPLRHESAWPLLSTQWTKAYLDTKHSSSLALSVNTPSTTSHTTFDALGDDVVFFLPPFEQETEITGPLALKLFASSSTKDMDFFVTLQAFSPDGREVDFEGTVDPRTPLAQGWLRASHRKIDTEKSLPYRPYHSHDEIQPLEPNTTYEFDIEILPTHIILPKGFRLALNIGGKDFQRPLVLDATVRWHARGSGPFLHTDTKDRPKDVFAGKTTIHTGGETSSYLLVPIIGK